MTKVPLLMCNTTTNNNKSSRGEENQKGSLMVKPKIRIIHVFAPKIIETDPANFRQLVQRLTGKLSARKGRNGNKRRNDHKMMVMRRGANEGLVPLEVQLVEEASSSSTSSPSCSWDRYRCDPMAGMKEEEEGMWRGGLEDFDGLVQGLVEFPFMPLLNNTSSDHHIDMLI